MIIIIDNNNSIYSSTLYKAGIPCSKAKMIIKKEKKEKKKLNKRKKIKYKSNIINIMIKMKNAIENLEK